MTELDIMNLQSGSVQSTGLYFIGMAFSIWVAFRVSSVVSQRSPDNVVMKAIASIFGLCVVYYFNMTMSFYTYNMELTGHRLANLKARRDVFCRHGLCRQYWRQHHAADIFTNAERSRYVCVSGCRSGHYFIAALGAARRR